MEATTKREIIEEVIREMIGKDRMTINTEMADEAGRRLGEPVDNSTISRVRNNIGLGSHHLTQQYISQKLDKGLRDYLKKYPEDEPVIERFFKEVYYPTMFSVDEFRDS